MSVIDPTGPVPSPTFVDGEPELEPPEELAVEVLDEGELLHDDVDCELVDEADLDEELAQATFDDLVHAADDDRDDPDGWPADFRCTVCFQVRPRSQLGDPRAVVCRRCAG